MAFIEAFSTFNEHYIYDVNSNRIHEVSDELYSVFKSHSLTDEKEILLKNKCRLEYENLLKFGYLSDNRIEEHSHPMTTFVSDFVSRKLSFMSLQITQSCNLRCNYCPYTENDGYNRLHSNLTMSTLVIDNALELLLNGSIDSEIITIGFYGGEPLLEFELIVYAVEKAKKMFWGKQLNFTITTNGTLFNSINLKFLNDNFFSILVSIDGPKHLNDKNRVFINSKSSVFDEVVKNIRVIYYNYENISKKLGMSMVIDPENDIAEYSNLFYEYKFLNGLIANITIVDESHSIIKKNKSDTFKSKIGYNAFLTYLEELGELNERSNSFYKKLIRPHILKNIEKLIPSENLPVLYSPSGQCIPGTRLFINALGYIYPCEKINENSEHVKMGNVFEGLNIEKTKLILNSSIIVFNKCQNCFAVRHCGNCIKNYSEVIDDNHNFDINSQCELIRKKFLGQLIAKAQIGEVLRIQKKMKLSERL